MELALFAVGLERRRKPDCKGVGVSGNDGVSLAGIGLQLDLHSIS